MVSEIVPIGDVTPDVFTPLARPDTDSWIEVVAQVSKLASLVASTDFVPRGLRDSAPATAAAILYGREVGLAPMTALTQIYIVDGKPSIAAEAMRAMVLAAGHELVFEETTGAVCRMRARRRGSQHWTSLEWNMDMARAAGLNNRDNWKRYPRAMLVARCTADLCRMTFPDILHGFRSLEETQDLEHETSAPPPRSSSTVQRSSKREAASLPSAESVAAVPPEPAAEPTSPPAPTAPPLPGEPDYDDTPLPIDEPPAAVVADEQPQNSPETLEDEPETLPMTAAERMDVQPVTGAQIRMMMRLFNKLGLGGKSNDNRAERLRLSSAIVGRTIHTANDLTVDEAQTLIDTLILADESQNDLRAIVDGIENER